MTILRNVAILALMIVVVGGGLGLAAAGLDALFGPWAVVGVFGGALLVGCAWGAWDQRRGRS